jgi:hypothetical protein
VLLRIGFKKLGVARIRKTGGIEIGFVDRRGDKPRAMSKADRIERRLRAETVVVPVLSSSIPGVSLILPTSTTASASC